MISDSVVLWPAKNKQLLFKVLSLVVIDESLSDKYSEIDEMQIEIAKSNLLAYLQKCFINSYANNLNSWRTKRRDFSKIYKPKYMMSNDQIGAAFFKKDLKLIHYSTDYNLLNEKNNLSLINHTISRSKRRRRFRFF